MKFSNSYIDLGEHFYQKCKPTAVAAPELLLWNAALAERLNIPAELQKDPSALAQYFSGNQLLEGSEPIAMAYSGHQFGNFNAHLGDGRAHLLGELIDVDGQRCDLQLKGSGPSAYSRRGDGRCAIGPAVREFIMSEAMQALGVPTTQCLAVVSSGESVYRQRAHPGAVVTRVASSHIRVGTFQYFAARGDSESLLALCDHVIARHYPHINEQDVTHRYVALLDAVIEKQIQLIVAWMRVGFIHGVMNTDNTAISGETIDFGPCAMMGVYNPATVYSSIDTAGRYAFANQPGIAQWNVTRFAECLLQVLDQENTPLMQALTDQLSSFSSRYQSAYQTMMATKCGLLQQKDGDVALIEALLKSLHDNQLDYTVTFNLLTQSLTCEATAATLLEQMGQSFADWQQRLTQQDASLTEVRQCMRNANPVVIPRNHHVEAVLKACEERGDVSAALAMLEVLRQPYTETEQTVFYQSVPKDGDSHYRTFCGT